MGLKIHAEIELPLSKDEAEGLMGLAMLSVSLGNGALADLEPEGPDKVCGAPDPSAPEGVTAICTYIDGHKGRHRFTNFGRTQEE